MFFAPLRIQKERSGRATLESASTPKGIEQTPYYERLIKLIPAEILSIYMIGKGVMPAVDGVHGQTAAWIWAGVCLLLLLFLRMKASSSTGKFFDAQWASVFIATISYIIWLYNMGGVLDAQPFYTEYKYIGALAILVWTFLVPYFYTGDEPVG